MAAAGARMLLTNARGRAAAIGVLKASAPQGLRRNFDPWLKNVERAVQVRSPVVLLVEPERPGVVHP
jgi:hypothetical protein